MSDATRTRFAPSPTGYLHIGNVRTALFNWLYARHTGGSFVLRVEDTDTERSKAVYEAALMEDLASLGLDWDEGPDKGGRGPYRQSERAGLYREYADKLVEKGLAYRCYCSKERLEGLKAEQIKKGIPPRYDNRCRILHDATAGVEPVVRFKVSDVTVKFIDRVHGEISFDAGAFGDFVIIGSDGMAAYNFAVVVDDALMGITDIIRGDDHISNTPRQMLIYKSLGIPAPAYSHIPLVLGSDRTPLGKRDPTSSLRALKDAGYLSIAIINTLARLGWSLSGSDDLLSLTDMAKAFSLDRLSKSPSIFDVERLRHFNKKAIEGLSTDEILNSAALNFQGVGKEVVREAIAAVRANAVTMNDFPALIAPFAAEPVYSGEALSVLKEGYAKKVIGAFAGAFAGAEDFDKGSYDAIMASVREATGEKGKRLFMPVRCALTGRTEGIELIAVLKLLGKDAVVKRLGLAGAF